MKKLLLLIGFIFGLSIFAMAQIVAPALNYSSTYDRYTGKATDTLGTEDSIWHYSLEKKNDYKVFPSIYLDIDSTGGTADIINIYLQGKIHNSDATYLNIDTVQWSMTGDTIITITPANSYLYQYWRLYLIGENDGMKAKVQKLEWKFVND